MKKVTLLIPCYNEENSLPALEKALNELMNANSSYVWEILFVNDGSKDQTLQLIKGMRDIDKRICYVDLSRNFGKENAMLAGFDYANGDCMVIMDADLQHPPSVIPEMLRKWEEGYDDVYGKRITRGQEPWLRKKLSLLFYKVLQKSARYDILQNVGDFRLLDRKCIEELKKIREVERYTKGMFAWIGFRKAFVEFETQDRIAGESHMRLFTLLKLAVNGITSFTVAPLKIATVLGFFSSIIAFVYMIYVFIKAFLYGDAVAGYPTIVILILFFGGIQLITLGIIGEYLGKVFNETKNRPVYIAQEVKGI